MSNGRSSFVWYELMTGDPASAQKFYHAVIGWTAVDAGVPGLDYHMLMAGSSAVAV